MTANEITALRAMAAFLIAGTYVATMARVAEHFGSKIGGLVLAMPSTVFVGTIFITVSEGHAGLRQASAVLPATIAAATIFLMVFVRLSQRGLFVAYSGAIAAWLAITVPLAATHLHDVRVALMLSAVLFCISTFSFRHVPHRSARKVRQSWHLLLLRFAVAGAIAAATVVVARFAGPLWGAVCASFPAVVSASLYLLWRAQGVEFTASLGRTMIVGCMVGVVFAIALYVLSAWLNSAESLVLAYVCTLVFGAFAYRFLIEALGRSRIGLS